MCGRKLGAFTLAKLALAFAARTEEADYYFTYIDQVAGSDFCQILETQLSETIAFLELISEDQSLARYAPGKWSMRQLLSHVTDTERVFVFRALWFARGFDSPLAGFDQDISVAGADADARQTDLQICLKPLNPTWLSSLKKAILHSREGTRRRALEEKHRRHRLRSRPHRPGTGHHPHPGRPQKPTRQRLIRGRAPIRSRGFPGLCSGKSAISFPLLLSFQRIRAAMLLLRLPHAHRSRHSRSAPPLLLQLRLQ